MQPPSETLLHRSALVLGVLVCVLVAFLVLGAKPAGTVGAMDVSRLPFLNAVLNGLTASMLVSGFVAIKVNRVEVHRALMGAAFVGSTAFLVSYLMYHWFSEGPVRYQGDFRGLYLFILLTHIVLAATIVPLALITLARAISGRFDLHRSIAPKTLAIWLYVSVTGVLIVWMAHV